MRAMLKGKRIATYARYSTDLQRDASIEDQQRELRRFIEANEGSEEVTTHLCDRAESGASLDRAGMQELLGLVRSRKVDVIVTEDMSRIARNNADSMTFLRELEFFNVQLIGVATGFDSSQPGARYQAVFEGFKNEDYIRDVAYKSRRGLEGRARAGFSTGGLPYGYRSTPVTDANGDTIGYRLAIFDEEAAVLRRIFEMYLNANSVARIAARLNEERVTLPRPKRKTKQRRAGWVDSTIRFMLHNEAYVGRWTFKKREWRKRPGTNKRQPRLRAPSEVMTIDHPELRIIDDETWSAVQQRLAETHARYTKTADGAPKGRGITGGSTNYLLSGLMICGCCGAPMVICGGSATKYYWCGDSRKRGTCSNKTSLREDIARSCILNALNARYASPKAIDYLRQRIAGHLGNVGRGINAELEERRARLARTEECIQNLVSFIAAGNASESVANALKDLEAQARTEKASIAAIIDSAEKPVRLPTPDDLLSRARRLSTLLVSDPTRGREALRRLFEGGQIKVTPQPDRTYVAESTLLPLMLFTADEAQSTSPPTEDDGRGRSFTASSCAGRI